MGESVIYAETADGWIEIDPDPYYAAVASNTRTVKTVVEIIDAEGARLKTLPVTSGSVSCDGSVDERWSANFQIDDRGLTPRVSTDVLHPFSNLRVLIWWMIHTSEGWAAVPCGAYYLSKPQMGHGKGGFTLAVEALDPIARIRRNTWGGGMLNLGGMTVSAALQAILTSRAPGYQWRITDTPYTLPATYEVGDADRDPWEDVLAIADAAAFRVYTDRLGVIIAEPRTVTGTATGPNLTGRITTLARSLDETSALNQVTVRSTSEEVDPPVYATVSDNDPSSPLWVGHGYIYSGTFGRDAITTVDQCRALAETTLRERRTLTEDVDVEMVADPSLDPWMMVPITDQATGAAGVYQVKSWALDLAPGSGMRLVARDRSQPII